MVMNLSRYQKQVLDFVKDSSKNGIVSAVAGSGKTTTLLSVVDQLKLNGCKPSEVSLLAFNKRIAEELNSKLANKLGQPWRKTASTLNSKGFELVRWRLGFSNWSQWNALGKLDLYKYSKLAANLNLCHKFANKGILFEEKIIENRSSFLRLIDLTRLANIKITEDDIYNLSVKYGLNCDFNLNKYSQLTEAIRQILSVGVKEAEEEYVIDFIDQVWLPVKWDMQRIPHKGLKFVLVDECQDLSPLQQQFILLLSQKARVLAVGDPYQAIMGFAGADDQSFAALQQTLQAVELPLSICYRCPHSVIDLVKDNFPRIQIEGWTQNSYGEINQIQSITKNVVQKGDMIISRLTAPVVKLCIELIASGISAKVEGRDIGENLISELNAIAKTSGFKFDNLLYHSYQYQQQKAIKYKDLDNAEELSQALEDKILALEAIYDSNDFNSKEEMINYIKALFQDGKADVILSTVHRAKGLEADRVFILEPEKLPLVRKQQQSWQYQQEMNLLYVALTRTKKELFVCGEPSWLREVEQERVA